MENAGRQAGVGGRVFESGFGGEVERTVSCSYTYNGFINHVRFVRERAYEKGAETPVRACVDQNEVSRSQRTVIKFEVAALICVIIQGCIGVDDCVRFAVCLQGCSGITVCMHNYFLFCILYFWEMKEEKYCLLNI